jgi:hypothetical protein
MIPTRPLRPRAAALAGLLLVLTITGCGTISRTPPEPTPADFPGMAGHLTAHGIDVSRIVSGDAGCDDVGLSKTAIGFDATGHDQATPVRIHVYIFRNRARFEQLAKTVDGCAAAYATDPATFESFPISPYVVAGQGPWGATFRASLVAAIREAAGTGN